MLNLIKKVLVKMFVNNSFLAIIEFFNFSCKVRLWMSLAFGPQFKEKGLPRDI